MCYGENYGEAAAIDVFGRRMGLPPAIGGHNNYYIWGPRGHDGSVMIIIGVNEEHYAAVFSSFKIAGRTATLYAMPYETDTPIYVLRGLKVPLEEFWPTSEELPLINTTHGRLCLRVSGRRPSGCGRPRKASSVTAFGVLEPSPCVVHAK